MIADLARLTRVRLCLLAAAGSAAGHLLWRAEAGWALPLTAGGAFLLAAGCSALNQVQERRRDAAMSRTRSRPLPAGRMGPGVALALALAFLALGLFMLWARGGAGPVLLGLLVVALYNGLYTPLKGLTPFALLMGAVAGSLPPLLGWLAAGGPASDFRVLLLALVFYLWQVPHFAFLARSRPGDYQAAGLPLAGWARAEGPGQAPLTVWLAGYCAAMILVPALGLVGTTPAKLFLAALALGLGLCGIAGLGRRGPRLRLANASLAMFLACLIADALWLGV